MDIKQFSNSIVITSKHYHDELIELRNQELVAFKIVDEREVIENLTFSFDDRALIYVHRLGYSYENASEVLSNIRFLKEGVSSKVDSLISLREDLKKENLLTFNDAYITFLKSKRVIIYQSDISKELKYLFEKYEIEYEIFKEEIDLSNVSIHLFPSMDDEFTYLITKTYELINAGVPTNKIKYVLPDSDYEYQVKKLQNMYGLAINFHKGEKLKDFASYKQFIDMVDNTLFNQAITFILDACDDPNQYTKIINKFIEVKDYILQNEEKEYLAYLGKTLSIPPKSFENEIEVLPLSSIKDDDYAIIIGFMLNVYPPIIQDNDYLSNKEKQKIGISTSIDKQDNLEAECIRNLARLKHAYISVAKKKGKEDIYPSLLITKYGLNVINEKSPLPTVLYSKSHYAFVLGKVLDDYNSFSVKSPYFASCDEDEISYLTYSHQFTGLTDFKPTSLKLSYSSVEKFFECSFAYYLNYIIKASEYEESLSTTIGNVFHKMIEEKTKGISHTWEEYLQQENVTPKGRIILDNLKPLFEKAIENHSSFMETSAYDSFLAEQDSYQYVISPEAVLEGKIDFIAYNSDYYMIIDFKTGSDKFEEKHVKDGFSMQLLLYYLLTQTDSSPVKGKILDGVYLNNVINKNYFLEDYSYLSLHGLTLSDIAFANIGNDYLGKAKLTPEEEFEELIAQVKENLLVASKSILEGDFKINPKRLNNTSNKCQYCAFADICYRDYKDYVDISGKEDK